MIVDLCGNKVCIDARGIAREELIRTCLEALRNVLCRCCRDSYLELIVYSSRYEKISFIMREAEDLGIVAVGDFKTLHEAWRGYPRIHVSQEDVEDLDEATVEALVAHEAVHAYLHGSPLSYVIYVPSSVLNAFPDPSEAYAVAYLLASAIKDIEVHRAMVGLGLYEYLERYALFCAKQLEDAECTRGSPLTLIANAIKLLTPFYVLRKDPPKCGWLLSTETFRELARSSLDDLHRVLETMLRELGGDEPPIS
ncbi:MAG: hypothetical protein GXO32_07490 [Crenarchaeota archaeon]|nr:hypothetical protein [Thermoproteota archaeon]